MSDAAPDPNLVSVDRAGLQTLQESYKLLQQLWDHPKHGAALKRAAKEVRPELRVPEIDVAEPLLAPIREELEESKKSAAELREEIAKDRKEREDEKALGDLSSKLTAAQRKHRLTDEAMAEVKKIMVDRGVSDPEIAAQYVVANIEAPRAVKGSNFGPTDANIFGIDGKSEEENIKALHDNPVRWMDKVVPEIMAEFDGEQAA